MKILIYSKIILLLFICCNNNNSKKNEEKEKFDIKIDFVGIIDKPLPTLIFLDKGEESFKLFEYNYTLNYDSYLELKKEIQKQNFKVRESTSLIHLSINKKQNYYLNKENSMLFISKLLDITEYKNNEQLKYQLNYYLRVIKSR